MAAKMMSNNDEVKRGKTPVKAKLRVTLPVAAESNNSCLSTKRTELAGISGTKISEATLKVGLLLAALDGHCDKTEIDKFKATAESCGGLSSKKANYIVSQMNRRISMLEKMSRDGVSADGIIARFITEANKIGITADCRNFIFWMSIAMVDGTYTDIERKAIAELQKAANQKNHLPCMMIFAQKPRHEISDVFLRRCELILSGLSKANATGDNILMNNRLKSLQTLVEIMEV